MFIIGEKINGMFKSVANAIKSKDEETIKKIAIEQISAGADALDINVGPSSSESPDENMKWLIDCVMRTGVVKSISIDTPSYEVMEKAALYLKENYDVKVGNKPILNSTTAESSRLKKMLDLALKTDSKLIILVMDSKGIPQDKDKKLELVASAIETAVSVGMSTDDIYIDPVVMPVAFKQDEITRTLEFIQEVKILSDPPLKTIVGLSNVSQGALKDYRSLLNRTFVAMALSRGLDAAILDPLDKELMSEISASEILLNKTIYCESFIDSFLKSHKI